MSIELPLDEMTIAEKLRVMEDIWNNLSQKSSDVPSPAWHEPILLERESLLTQGKEETTNWEEAKKRIRESLA